MVGRFDEDGSGGREERKDESGTDDPAFGTCSLTESIDGDDDRGCDDPSVPRNDSLLGDLITGERFTLDVCSFTCCSLFDSLLDSDLTFDTILSTLLLFESLLTDSVCDTDLDFDSLLLLLNFSFNDFDKVSNFFMINDGVDPFLLCSFS